MCVRVSACAWAWVPVASGGAPKQAVLAAAHIVLAQAQFLFLGLQFGHLPLPFLTLA
jgi:hypothetical protein